MSVIDKLEIKIPEEVRANLVRFMNEMLAKAAGHILPMYEELELDDFIDGLIRWCSARLGVERYAHQTDSPLHIERRGQATIFRCNGIPLVVCSVKEHPSLQQFQGRWVTAKGKRWLSDMWRKREELSFPFFGDDDAEELFVLAIATERFIVGGVTGSDDDDVPVGSPQLHLVPALEETILFEAGEIEEAPPIQSWRLRVAFIAPICDVKSDDSLIVDQAQGLDLMSAASVLVVREEKVRPVSSDDLEADRKREDLRDEDKGES